MENLIYNIVELDGKDKYLIVNQALYKNKNYYLAARLDENEEDITDEISLFVQSDVNGEKAFELVTDENTINLLAKYFKPAE